MLEEAEQNATKDKSKKSLVNITYEFDNLLAKSDRFIFANEDLNTDAFIYFKELIETIKNEYKSNKLEIIANKYLDKLKYSYGIMMVDFFKQELQNTQSSLLKSNSGEGVVIDVTEE